MNHRTHRVAGRRARLAGLSLALAVGASCSAANEDSELSVESSLAQGEVTLWTDTSVPAVAAAPDASAVELGVKFRSDSSGFVSGIRFYKGSGNGGTHVGHLWSSTGTLLGSATFTGETATGWQTARFASPIAISANTTYVASYHAPLGRYSASNAYFGSAGVDRAPLHALSSSAAGGNGVYRYGASAFPNQSYQATNYWVDVVFQPAATPGSGTGLTGQYYDNRDFTNLKLTRRDATVNFSWGSLAPDAALGADTFSVRWTGQVQPLHSESYTFTTNSDDGVRLTVNGQTLIDNWTDHAPTENRGTITLTAGQKYDLKLEYYENGGGAVSQLSWSSARQAKQIIPATQLYPAATSGTGGTGGSSTGGASSGGVSTGGASSGGASSGGTGGTSCPAGSIGTPPNCFSAPPIAPATGKRWAVTFTEEFNGTDYDRAKLSPCFDWNYGACTHTFNNGREHYDPGQVRVSNGTAKLVAEPLRPPLATSACYQGQCTYKSGLLSTCRPNAGNGSGYLYKFTYGYVEGRMKFPATRGFFTAFWMLPADPSYNYRSEIDIVEILGDDPYSIFMTYHYSGRSQSHALNRSTRHNGACAVKDYSTDFHRFGMDWQPDHVAWYIDGTKCGEFTGTTAQVESGPMMLILDLMVDHSWQQSWGVTLQDTTLVRQLEVDYLRVYQQVQ